MKIQPPKRSLKFLRWFCREDFIEEIEGDLVELFEKRYEWSPAKAKRSFTWSVLKYFRPAFIKSFQKINNSNTTAMFKNYLKVSWRNLKRQPFFTALNTFGLAIGMTGALLISLFLYDELTYDKMFADADRIYRVNIDNKIAGEANKYAAVSGPLAEIMRRDYPHLENLTRFKHTGSRLIRQLEADQNVKEDNVVGADPAFFSMFGFDLILGDKNSALSEAKSLVMTRSAAEKHFGLNDALGQQMLLDNDEVFLVTGIIEDLPDNSFLKDYSLFLSITSFADHDSPAWNNWNFPTFIKLKDGASVPDLQDYLASVKDRYLLPWAMKSFPGLTMESVKEQEASGNYMVFDAIPLTDIHLYSPNLSGDFNLNGDIQDVYILSFIGIFLVLLASVNFMNLSTARSLKRSKEVGIRKTLGSVRSAIIGQFLTEGILVTFLSLVLAIGLASLAMPYFNVLAGKSMTLPFDRPSFWLIVLGASLLLGLFSGSYPAFLMSKFSPLKGLRGGEQTVGGAKTRSLLVIIQFAVSVFLIASTLVVFRQLNFIQGKDLGFQKDQILVLNDVSAVGEQIETFKQEIDRLAKVEHTSLSSYLPTPSDRSGVTYFPEGEVFQASSAIIIDQWHVDFDYVPTLNINLVSGRNFDRDLTTDSLGVILNESAIKMLGKTPEEVLGMRITDDFRNPDEAKMKFYTVIGVVKNFHFETMRNNIDALSLIIGRREANLMMIKLNASDFSETIDQIDALWGELAPGQPFDYYFMDDSFNEVYKAEQRLGSIFITFTTLSIFIACLGLFGLAAFNAERRAKEIGIRKVLGATVTQITLRLSSDFLKLVVIGIIISLPLAWFAMDRWLQDFSYRIEIGWLVFAMAAAVAVLISILTVSHQSMKAALSNPIKSLRSE
ncbi:ABC transporter permease [Roseivirga sp. E12]|uniref:ABC transporter permease n=1 Tax=Roseivirga sp. E12 TaxID=2819237 RepID=UPI001F422ACE|nr:ABC transporter permease [Roseivirga sp. E12]